MHRFNQMLIETKEETQRVPKAKLELPHSDNYLYSIYIILTTPPPKKTQKRFRNPEGTEITQ